MKRYNSLRKILKSLILDKYPIIKDYKLAGDGDYITLIYYIDRDYFNNLFNSPEFNGHYINTIYNDPTLVEISNLTMTLYKMLGENYHISDVKFYGAAEEDDY